MAEPSKESIKVALEKVMEKAKSDPVARQNLVRDPHGAIRQISGYVVPEHVKIAVVDGEAAHVTVVLPPRQRAEGELSEQQLEQVAGGKGFNQTAFNESMQVLGGLAGVGGVAVGTGLKAFVG